MANQIIIDIGAVANDGTGDPLRTAFGYVNNNFSNVWATGVANSNIQFSGNRILTTNTNGNLVLAPNGIGKVQSNVDIVPNANNTLNLGSLTRQWNTVYAQYLEVSREINLGGDLTVNGNLTVEGDTIQLGNIVTDTKTIQLANTAGTANAANGSGITVGANDNIATILYNSTSNVWTTNIGISATGNVTAPYFVGNGSLLTGTYGNSNVAAYLPTYTGNLAGGNLTVSSAGNTWTISDQFLTAPGGAYWHSHPEQSTDDFVSAPGSNIKIQSISANSVVESQIDLTSTNIELVVVNGVTKTWKFNEFGTTELPGDITPVTAGGADANVGNVSNPWTDAYFSGNVSAGNINSSTINNSGNISVVASGNTWTFNESGSTIFPTLTVTRGDRTGTLTGQTLLFGDSTQEALISTPDGVANVTPNSQRLVINPGQGAPGTTGEGGDIYLYAGRGGDAGGSGGDIKIRGGLGPVDGAGGYLDLQGGDTQGNGVGGYIDIRGGQSGNAAGGAVNVYGGYGVTDGGAVNITGGESANGLGNYGNVSIGTGASTWTFDNTGNLALPRGGVVYETNIPGGGLDGNTIALKPSGGTNADQQLMVYPTAGNVDANHLHLTTGNLYNTELFLGNDDLYVKLANTGNVVVNSNDNTGNSAQWTFGTNESLTLPCGSRLRPLGANLDIFAGTGSYVNLITADESSYMGVDGSGGYIVTAGGTWGFSTTGNLTAPGNVSAVGNITGGNIVTSGSGGDITMSGGNITGVGNISAGNVNTTGNVTAANFFGNGATLSNVATQVASSWTLAAGTNTANITVPLNGTYSMWVRGNIPNGIVVWNATVTVTNNNVPAIGQQFAWYYPAPGNALVLTSIPAQIIGTANTISNATPAVGTTTNVFEFTIDNNSGNSAVVNYGYTKIS